jgi:hypothetical protein
MDELNKKENFYGFFKTIADNYSQTIVFIIIIIGILVGLKYAQTKLDFPNSKMILNWFGIIVICNLFITYSILMTYQQVKNQRGFQGSAGYQGPIGSQGYIDYCTSCDKKIDTFEQVYEDTLKPQPLLPEKITVERTKALPKKFNKKKNNLA